MFKKEQSDLKRKMDNLNELIQHKKQNCFQRNESKPHRGTHEKKLNLSSNDLLFIKEDK